MSTSLPHRRALLAGIAAALAAPSLVRAQAGYPNRAISLLIPFPPGGGIDVIGRLVGDKLSHRVGQPVIVDNRAGVNGSLAADIVARAKPDGYTLVIGSPGTHGINQLINPNVKYDARKDFTHIALLTRVPLVMVASPALQFKTVAEVVAASKAKPNSLNVALTGNGSSGHMTTELFKQAAGVQLNAVPYKGEMPAMTDLMGGQADLLFLPATSALPFVTSGKLRALAVCGTARIAALPDVPTMAEAGQPKVVNYSWTSLEGPAGMPADVVRKLNAEAQAILALPDVRERLLASSNEPTPGTPEQAGAFIAAEVTKWAEVVKLGHIRME